MRDAIGNTMALCDHFYGDRSLQEDLRLVSTASRFVLQEYKQTLLDQKTQDAKWETTNFWFGINVRWPSFSIK